MGLTRTRLTTLCLIIAAVVLGVAPSAQLAPPRLDHVEGQPSARLPRRDRLHERPRREHTETCGSDPTPFDLGPYRISDPQTEDQRGRCGDGRERDHGLPYDLGRRFDLDRGAHLWRQGIAVENCRPVDAILCAERRGALKIEEELAEPVVSHGSLLCNAGSRGG